MSCVPRATFGVSERGLGIFRDEMGSAENRVHGVHVAADARTDGMAVGAKSGSDVSMAKHVSDVLCRYTGICEKRCAGMAQLVDG